MMINQMVVDHFIAYEGKIPHFYLDGEGIVTIGIGCVVFEPATLAMVRKSDNVKASIVDIMQEYRAVKAMESGHVPSYYGKVCGLYLPDPEINQLFHSRLTAFIKQIEDSIAQLNEFPQTAALALVDMAFNLGIAGLTRKFPRFMNAFMAKDWEMCSRECFRQGIQSSRNDWTRRTFETLAKEAA